MSRQHFVKAAAGLGLAFLAACGADSQVSSEESSVGMSVLELTILDCQRDRIQCVLAAQGISDIQACDAALRTCLETVFNQGSSGPTPAPTGPSCAEQARSCIEQGGVQAIPACRADFEACLAAAAW